MMDGGSLMTQGLRGCEDGCQVCFQDSHPQGQASSSWATALSSVSNKGH